MSQQDCDFYKNIVMPFVRIRIFLNFQYECFQAICFKISTNCGVFFKLDKHCRLSQKIYISNSKGKPDDFYTSVYDIPENSQSTIHNVVHDY